MNPLTMENLAEFASRPVQYPANWIKVCLDTGGIAAGAERVYNLLLNQSKSLGLDVAILRTGTLGLSFVDPTVEVCVNGMPEVLYGHVDEEVAHRILTEHVIGKILIEDHLIAPRHRATKPAGTVTHILVRDTSVDDGKDKSGFYQYTFQEELKKRGLQEKVQVVRALDMGIYGKGVVVQVLPSGITFTNVLVPDIARIIEKKVIKHELVEDLIEKLPDKQVRVVTRNCGIVDPESLEDSLAHGGYQGLAKALRSTPEKVIEEMKTSGLRGRGGAGFPTWLKWHLTREQQATPKYVICNGDEGDPGAFMDRSVLEADPHSVMEGLMIAAYCVGASMGYFYIRAEYPMAVARIEKAIVAARQRGLLGKNILGTGFSFDAKVRLGAGAFVCGEETALIASIEGKRGSPSPRPPFPSVKGLWGQPTVINNVETLAAASAIIDRGGAWYAEYGVDKSRGTKVFAVVGKVKNPQLVEVPMGTTLREIIFDICGGIIDNKEIKAVQTGGPSGGVIPEKFLDTPVTYENLQALGSIMGSGGLLAMDKTDCMVDVAKFYLKFCVDESCGKCAPCRIGGYQMLTLLDKISRGRGQTEDLEQLRRICLAMQKASLCGLGQTAPNPVLSTLRYFEPEYRAYIEGGNSYARKMRKLLSGSETE